MQAFVCASEMISPIALEFLKIFSLITSSQQRRQLPTNFTRKTSRLPNRQEKDGLVFVRTMLTVGTMNLLLTVCTMNLLSLCALQRN